MGINRNLERNELAQAQTIQNESPSTSTSPYLKEKVTPSNLTETYQERKKNASHLASQYTSTKRWTEILFIILFTVFLVLSVVNVWNHLGRENALVLICSFVFSALLADMFSGLVHWGADTWGTLETPFVGKSFIRSFREHHVDPYRITIHDTIETNGDNAMLTFPSLALISFINVNRLEENGEFGSMKLFTFSFIFYLTIWVAITNQFHKWAHMRKPPTIISILQNWKIILPRKEHQIHHHNPFDRYYCITNGWLNPVLSKFSFWKRLEVLVSEKTSLVPRQDDAFWTLQK